MAPLKLVLSVFVILALAQAAPRKKRQVTQQYPQQQYPGYTQTQTTTFNCPTTNGQYSYPADCTKFYQCDGGVATVADCQSQLVFNAQTGFCDWPYNVPSCAQPSTTQIYKPEIGNVCQVNQLGGNAQESFHVGHHMYCNAFFTCTTGYMFGQCTFCPDGSYFNKLAGGCRALPAGILDTSSLCGGLTYVAQKDQTRLTLGDDCWPFANIANPWAQIAITVGNSNQTPYNPNTNTYNPNTNTYNPNTNTYYPNTNTYNPNTYNPNTYNPNTNTYNANTYNPNTYVPNTNTQFSG
ncbi:hypothetical protein EGW08_006885 [Elysia chlorotica]|uniref:Chitin-binding type-2 domain-containing protein n=1 Tax=Elysia chlorotica TaxID=188477 RepID=A0A3S1BJM2_ELYCH|nr:hypothetical protein EGW08_006885 [Elysia chlorotica]